MQKDGARTYISWIALAILIVISFFIIKPYIIALISAFILAYLVRPWNKILEKRMSKALAAIVTIIITLLIILVPIGAIITEVASQTYNVVQGGVIDRAIAKLAELNVAQQYNIDAEAIKAKALQIGFGSLTGITASLATLILSLFIMVFAMYYLLVQWDVINARIKKYIPFPNKEHLLKDLGTATKKIVHGTLFISIIEFIIAALGFWIAGSNFFLLLAALIALFAFVPGGPAIVWAPAAVIEFIQGNYVGAIIILAFGLFISIYIDTIFRAKIAGKQARIHPLTMLLGILGGTAIFGIPGLLIGPLLLSYTIEILGETIGDHTH